LSQQQQLLDRRYRAIAQTFPAQTAAPEQLAQTVTLARQLDARQPDLPALLTAIGQALQSAPEITLESLSWRDSTPTLTGDLQVNLDAALTPFDGNYRAAMQRIERFMHTLKAIPAVQDVSLSSSPVNADSSSTLSGKTFDASLAESQAEATSARFSLSLVYREAKP